MSLDWSMMTREMLKTLSILRVFLFSYAVLAHFWHHHIHQNRHHDQWDAAQKQSRMQRIFSFSRMYLILFPTWLFFWSSIDLRSCFAERTLRSLTQNTSIQLVELFERSWISLTALRSSRLDSSCLAKCLSCARLMSSLSVQSDDTEAVNYTILRSNSWRAQQVSHCRDRLSQNQLDV